MEETRELLKQFGITCDSCGREFVGCRFHWACPRCGFAVPPPPHMRVISKHSNSVFEQITEEYNVDGFSSGDGFLRWLTPEQLETELLISWYSSSEDVDEQALEVLRDSMPAMSSDGVITDDALDHCESEDCSECIISPANKSE